jgi:RimJ/RimL family protein N-acetyltransferase
MTTKVVIETERLILRPYTDADREPIAAMNAHPDVGAWLMGPLSRADSDAFVDRVSAMIDEYGFGFFCAERKADGRVIGSIGMLIMGEGMPATGAIELGWRLHPDGQGTGLATEGAAACRDWAFANLDIPEVVAITATTNVRSQAVMRKIGMTPDPSRDFDHPRMPADHPLRRHVFYALAR